MIRNLERGDYPHAVQLYQHLASVAEPEAVAGRAAFERLLAHPGTDVLGFDTDGEIRSMLTLHLLPNMTYRGAAYALVENVVTLPAHRRKGLSKALFGDVERRVRAQGGYKIMLLTGRRNAALGFYQALGYDAEEKWGLVKRLT